MGKTSRKKYTPEVKAQVAIEALKEQSTLAGVGRKLVRGMMALMDIRDIYPMFSFFLLP